MILVLRSQCHGSGVRLGKLGAWFLAIYLAAGNNAWAQQLGRGGDDGIPLWRIIAALAVCASVAVAAALILKHRMRGGIALFRAGRAGPRLAVIESLRLRPQTELCIVSCDTDQFLIAISPQGVHLLRSLPEEVARGESLTSKP
jgi:hypothetical protein